jgi:hypothetical protein
MHDCQFNNLTPMRHFILLFVLALSQSLTAQISYQRISDQSGYLPTTGQIAELEAAARRLLDSIPQPQRDSFGIFEVGFYLHNPVTDGGTPEAFQMAIAAAASRKPYYILFGKQSDASGLCTRFWVDLELPLGGEFSCLNKISAQIRSDLAYKYQFIANKTHTTNALDPYLYHVAVTTTLDSLTSKVTYIKDCCEPVMKRANPACVPCEATPDEIAQFFKDKGYVAI